MEYNKKSHAMCITRTGNIYISNGWCRFMNYACFKQCQQIFARTRLTFLVGYRGKEIKLWVFRVYFFNRSGLILHHSNDWRNLSIVKWRDADRNGIHCVYESEISFTMFGEKQSGTSKSREKCLHRFRWLLNQKRKKIELHSNRNQLQTKRR